MSWFKKVLSAPQRGMNSALDRAQPVVGSSADKLLGDSSGAFVTEFHRRLADNSLGMLTGGLQEYMGGERGLGWRGMASSLENTGKGAFDISTGSIPSIVAIAKGKDGGGGATTPPDINEANDPDTAAQFQRIRKAARMLGRAGTIKNKSAQTLGGGADGEQTLGTQLAVA
jgi:hypothetical protein